MFLHCHHLSEEGEETNPLPYVRLSKRVHKSTGHNPSMTEADMIETMAIREIAPDRLLATKRIVNAFNAGDIESIRDIVYESTLDICEVYFSNLHHVFIGRAALFSLWSSLFEAFPNGIFRTSDSVINEKKQVFTSFLFFGTKIFPLLIDGLPLEILTTTPATTTAAMALSAMAGFSSSSDKRTAASQAQQLMMPSPSVKVDRNQPMFTTAELLEAENIPEMVFEGRIVLHMNEHCKIRKFDFAWNRKM